MTVLVVDKHYNFSVHAPSILGSNYKNARLMSILNYQTALRFGDVVLRHRQVYPYLPADTDNDQTKYKYYLFDIGGRWVVLADVWLIPESVEVTTGGTVVIRMHNITDAQVTILRDQFRLMGLSFDINQA